MFVVMEYDSDKINKDISRACPEERSYFRSGAVKDISRGGAVGSSLGS